MDKYHTSVLLDEVIDQLIIKKGAKYIDATLGGGGISVAILERGGKVLGLDVDKDALDYVGQIVQSHRPLPGEKAGYKINEDIFIVKGNFRDIYKIANDNNFGKITGIVFDLGVSSHQFDSGERGFSFRNPGPLDMRMDQELKIQAKDLVNILTKGELYELFHKLGEERFSNTIAKSIVSARQIKLIQTSRELFEIINRAIPNSKTKLDSIARIYQALRIAVNDELNNLRSALPQAIKLLEAKGKIAVISFHSLEDRIVKNQFLEWQNDGLGNILTKKPIRPTRTEIEKNKRSRSAKLRLFERN